MLNAGEGESMSNDIPFTETKGIGLELPMASVLKGIGQTGEIPKADIAGMIVGGLAGYLLARKWPNFIVKWVGVIAFANLGIVISRWISNRTQVSRGNV